MGGLSHARVSANGRTRVRCVGAAIGLGHLEMGVAVGRRVGAAIGHGMGARMGTLSTKPGGSNIRPAEWCRVHHGGQCGGGIGQAGWG